MNNSLIIGIVVVIALAVGGYFAWQTMQGSEGDRMMEDEEGNMMENEDTGARDLGSGQASGRFSGSLADLGARGGNWKCTFTHESDVGSSSGTVYVAGSEIRGDFQSVESVTGQSVESHMIQTGGYIYTWTGLLPQGFKSKVTGTTSSGSTGTSGQYSDVNQQYSYDCDPWVSVSSMFSLPTGVSFMEAGY